MRLHTILFGQAIRILNVTGAAGGSVYGSRLSKAFEEHYGFLQGPRTLEDFNLSKGITYLHGHFGGMVVDRVTVYPNGLLAESKLNTDFCDAFLDDVVKWAKQEQIMEISDVERPQRFYTSNLEFESSVNIPGLMPELASIGHRIANQLSKYGQSAPDFQVTGFSLGPRSDKLFKFERRDGSATLHFSSAPLRTADHVQTIECLERALTQASAS